MTGDESTTIHVGYAILPPQTNQQAPLLDIVVTGGNPSDDHVRVELAGGREFLETAETGIIQQANEPNSEISFEIEGSPIIQVNGQRVTALTILTLTEDTFVEIIYTPRLSRTIQATSSSLSGSVTVTYAGTAPIAGGMDTTETFNVNLHGNLSGGRIESISHPHGGTFNNVFICGNHRAARPTNGTFNATATFSHSANGRRFYDVWVSSGDLPPGVNGPIWGQGPPLSGTQGIMGRISFAEPQDGYARVQKVSAGSPDYVQGNPNFSLANAVYWVFDNEVRAAQTRDALNNGASINSLSTANRVGILTTNANGLSNTVSLPQGTYWAVEITPSLGHFRDDTVHTVNVQPEQTTTFTSHQPVPNDPTWLQLQKLDAETGLPTPQGDGTFQGIQYTVRWYPLNRIPNANDTPRRTWVFETNAQGRIMFRSSDFLVGSLSDPIWIDAGGNIRWPLGVVTFQETSAPSGLIIDPTVHVGFVRQHPTMPENGIFEWADGSGGGLMVYRDGTGFEHGNEVVRGDVAVEKRDVELEVSEAMSGTSLAGIEFEIVNRSINPVVVGGETFAPNEVVMSIFTAWDEPSQAYVARTTGGTLPYGTYDITEVRGNTYYLTEQELGRPAISFTFEIREDGETVRHDPNNEPMTFDNQVRRGDLAGVKIAEGTARRLSHIPFAITNHASGETNILISDDNGEINTHHSWNSRQPDNVNINNHLLDMEANGDLIQNTDVDMHGSVWFGIGEFGTIAPVHPTLGALPFGWYTIRELRAENNIGFELLEIDVFVSRHGHVLNLGTLTNINEPDATFQISTQAHTGDGDNQFFWHGDTLYLYDTVEIEVCEATGHTLRFQADLHNRTADGEVTLVYTSEYVYFTVEETEDGCFVDTFEIRTSHPIDTRQFERGSEFFWSERLYLRNIVDGEYEEVYHHNPDGDDPNQTLHPKYAYIVTQAWVEREDNQYFYYPLVRDVRIHDDIRITHVNIAPDSPMAFRPVLNIMWQDGTSDVFEVLDLVAYTVENVLNWNHSDPNVMDFLVYIYLDPDIVNDIVGDPNFDYFFWSEYLYRIDEDDELDLIYEHNKDGADDNQTLIPVPRPEEVIPPLPPTDPTPDVPSLPQTGTAVMHTILIGVGVVMTAMGIGIGLAKRHQTGVKVIKIKPTKIKLG